ncbi:MAG: hypothetical protein ACYST6_01940 [Planctomycetota bacterium]|jgi:hypothetical protein
MRAHIAQAIKKPFPANNGTRPYIAHVAYLLQTRGNETHTAYTDQMRDLFVSSVDFEPDKPSQTSTDKGAPLLAKNLPLMRDFLPEAAVVSPRESPDSGNVPSGHVLRGDAPPSLVSDRKNNNCRPKDKKTHLGGRITGKKPHPESSTGNQIREFLFHYQP